MADRRFPLRRTTLIIAYKLYIEYKTTKKTEAQHIVAEAKVNHGTQFTE